MTARKHVHLQYRSSRTLEGSVMASSHISLSLLCFIFLPVKSRTEPLSRHPLCYSAVLSCGGHLAPQPCHSAPESTTSSTFGTTQFCIALAASNAAFLTLRICKSEKEFVGRKSCSP